ncbi:MAG: hypothetical protein NC334_09415 [Bacteroides sp.]|nr:hypothetical protein [Bacteroides sp.]
MEITNITYEEDQSSPCFIDVVNLQKKVRFWVLLFSVIFFIFCGYISKSYYNRVVIIKERFICNGSKCKIIYLNGNNNIMPTPKRFFFDSELKPSTINRRTIGNIEVRHLDTAAGNNVMLGTREHRYYIRFIPKDLDKENYEDYLRYNLIELGPVSNEKYANEILKQLKSSIDTDKDIAIEIELGSSRSFR